MRVKAEPIRPLQSAAGRSPAPPPRQPRSRPLPQLLTIEHSGPPGRLRLRSAQLAGRPERCRRLAERLAREAALTTAKVRALTGSVVVTFAAEAPAAGIVALVEARLAELAGAAGEATPPAAAATATAAALPAAAPPVPGAPSGLHDRSLAELLADLAGDPVRGLDADSVEASRRRFGANLLPEAPRPSPLALLAKQFDGLPVLLLAGSSVVSLATGGLADAAATLAVIAANGVLGFVTEGQAERTIHRLFQAESPSAPVIRAGCSLVLPAAEIVPGDLLLLLPGLHVPADARLIEADGLLLDESVLTGESVPVEKLPLDGLPAATPLAERSNSVHAGTLVAAGRGRALAVATGAATEAARIQGLSERASRPRAPVEQELEGLARRLVYLSLAACAGFFLLGALRGYRLPAMLRDALALAVAAVPEGLPVTATTTLALGLRRMEKKGILIRRLDAVETLGAVQTVCLDKTGTLTRNEMSVRELVAGGERLVFDDGPAGPFGTPGNRSLAELLEIAALNREPVEADAGGPSTAAPPPAASATERALVELAVAGGLDPERLARRLPRRHLLERSRQRRYLTSVHEAEAGPLTFVKGSPEEVLGLCSHRYRGEEREPLDAAERGRILAENDRLGSLPARVLGFARGDGDPGEAAPSDMTWLGLAAMVDPLRPEAKEFIAALHRAGLETVLITGDQSATASAIARELGLSRGEPLRTFDSAHLDELAPETLAALAPRTHVFSRVSPHQKLAIVRALQAAGRVVAMTGDGVNDGPALRAADIGIAMGRSGTPLARDAANVVIAGDQLTTLIGAMAEGRTVYGNIRRALEFLITTNLSEILVSIVEALHGPGELETPLELLWINLVTDVLPGLGLALGAPQEDSMSRPPRAPDEPIVPRSDLLRIGADGLVISGAALASHFLGLARYGAGPQTRGMTFMTLALGQLLYTLACQKGELRRVGELRRLFANPLLDGALLASIGLQLLPFLLPPLGRLLGIAPLRPLDLALSMGLAGIPLGTALLRGSLPAAATETSPDPAPLAPAPCLPEEARDA